MDKSNNAALNSLGLQMLAIAFIVLKLVGVITWSWWWVLAPLWLPTVVVLVVLLLVLVIRFAFDSARK